MPEPNPALLIQNLLCDNSNDDDRYTRSPSCQSETTSSSSSNSPRTPPISSFRMSFPVYPENTSSFTVTHPPSSLPQSTSSISDYSMSSSPAPSSASLYFSHNQDQQRRQVYPRQHSHDHYHRHQYQRHSCCQLSSPLTSLEAPSPSPSAFSSIANKKVTSASPPPSAPGSPTTVYHRHHPYLTPPPHNNYITINSDLICAHYLPTHSYSSVKAKRKRASPTQIMILEHVFEHTAFPSTALREELGEKLGMEPRAVQIWFQNKRQATKRDQWDSATSLQRQQQQQIKQEGEQ